MTGWFWPRATRGFPNGKAHYAKDDAQGTSLCGRWKRFDGTLGRHIEFTTNQSEIQSADDCKTCRRKLGQDPSDPSNPPWHKNKRI